MNTEKTDAAKQAAELLAKMDEKQQEQARWIIEGMLLAKEAAQTSNNKKQ